MIKEEICEDYLRIKHKINAKLQLSNFKKIRKPHLLYLKIIMLLLLI